MKTIALLAIALLTACASKDLIENRSLDCASGQDIEVQVGYEGAGSSLGNEDRFEMLVEVANNSDDDLTVASIRVEQPSDTNATYRIDSSFRKFDQVIEEGKDHVFRLPVTGRELPRRDTRTVTTAAASRIFVHVHLTNGDSYRCSFDVGPLR